MFASLNKGGNKANQMAATINIGKTIREELLQQGRSVTWLSRQLGTSRMACYRIFDCYSIDTQLLLRISELLGVDFFKLYSKCLNDDNVTAEP